MVWWYLVGRESNPLIIILTLSPCWAPRVFVMRNCLSVSREWLSTRCLMTNADSWLILAVFLFSLLGDGHCSPLPAHVLHPGLCLPWQRLLLRPSIQGQSRSLQWLVQCGTRPNMLNAPPFSVSPWGVLVATVWCLKLNLTLLLMSEQCLVLPYFKSSPLYLFPGGAVLWRLAFTSPRFCPFLCEVKRPNFNLFSELRLPPSCNPLLPLRCCSPESALPSFRSAGGRRPRPWTPPPPPWLSYSLLMRLNYWPFSIVDFYLGFLIFVLEFDDVLNAR